MIAYRPASTRLPSLPFLLWKTPPGLELALTQEGVAFRNVLDPHPLSFQAGRFVLFDGRSVAPSSVRERLSPEHVAIDVDALRVGEPVDPFDALLDSRSRLSCWDVESYALTERISRYPKAAVRGRMIDRLRRGVISAGGIWARIAPFPFPFRSAFNFRADLDEDNPEDYARFARACRFGQGRPGSGAVYQPRHDCSGGTAWPVRVNAGDQRTARRCGSKPPCCAR